MVQKEAMEDTVARDLLMPATATGVTEGDTEVSEEVMQEDTEVSEEDTEEVMEVTMVDMDTEGKFCAQHPFDSPEPSSFIMSLPNILLLSNQKRMKMIFSKCKIRKEIQ